MATTFVRRAPSDDHPLPTETEGSPPIDVRELEHVHLRFKVDESWLPPPAGSYAYPVGMQAVAFPAMSNRTLSYYGNFVNVVGDAPDIGPPTRSALERPAFVSHSETIGGE